MHFAVSWRKEDGFCSLLSLTEEKQSKNCESWVAQFSISANILSCLNQMCALGFNKAYFVCKVRFRTIHVPKNPFYSKASNCAAQLLSLSLKYFKESWVSIWQNLCLPESHKTHPTPFEVEKRRNPWNSSQIGQGNGSKGYHCQFRLGGWECHYIPIVPPQSLLNSTLHISSSCKNRDVLDVHLNYVWNMLHFKIMQVDKGKTWV